MKRFIVITFIFLFAWNGICSAQNGKVVVQNFAENMQMWIKTDDISYRERIEEICNGSKNFRIKDGFTKLIVQPLVQTPFITLSCYLNKIESLRPNISFHIVTLKWLVIQKNEQSWKPSMKWNSLLAMY